ncbi:hypothetical protein A2876_04625 [Candidatus Amesbacteria bacterium RIFCSPHIGHO2_01_FULL_48_32b]|uniref:DNA primase/polymerase bifunctional N-terminal domain-containing protein n=1 Tax=Candidatus Amesbacteria bacterium RIFCSPHIGHO2_01_FULL_48_32b TaxID=1797253 RepID=A0A1F4YCV6_9BACT|nr:MAG: hypothetical protein A2876_04625 [Candidatus Amesbacteria bacterium RIFCSPHIGHO2_01_FULL_48_32b]
MLGQAFFLAEKGWSVIPVGLDKVPLVKWEKFQSVKPADGEIFEWFGVKFLDRANLGVITGKISGIVVVDIDPRHSGSNEMFAELGTLAAKTGGGGWHYYFKFEPGIQNQAGIQSGIDIRGDGGYVVVPPSLHQSGNRYEWINDLQTTPILPLPDFIKEWLVKREIKEYKSNWSAEKLDGVGEGRRNETAASVVGKLIATFPRSEWGTEVWKLSLLWNKENNPPLPETELRQVFDSICQRELMKIPGRVNDQTVSLEEALEAVEAVLPGKRDLTLLAMATCVSHLIDKKTPLWLMFVGVPSSAKTEVARMVGKVPWVYFLDALTENAFVSGMKDSKDLLPLLNGKCLVVKDFTTTLSQKEETVKKILGDLTSIYDDSFAKHSPMRGTVEYHSFFSLLGCVTPQALNRHQRYMNQIGPRFLFYRVPNSSQEEVEKSFEVLWSVSDSRPGFKNAHDKVSGYCNGLLGRLNETTLGKEGLETKELLNSLAKFISKARGMVLTRSAEFVNAENEKVQFYEPIEIQIEEPFRALQQLRVLARSLAVVQGKEEVGTGDLRLVRQVALASMPADRSLLLSVILSKDVFWTAKQVADAIGISHKTALRQLDELVTLKILLKFGQNGLANEYVVEPGFKPLLYGGEELVSRLADLGTGTETPRSI